MSLRSRNYSSRLHTLCAVRNEDELCVLAAQVKLKNFAARQRIYKVDNAVEPPTSSSRGRYRVTMVDADKQEYPSGTRPRN